jgi:PAS domain S-box-containing protein
MANRFATVRLTMRESNDPSVGWWEPLVQVSLDGQFVLRPIDAELSDFEVLYSNETGARLGGLTPAKVIGRLLSDVAPPYRAGLRESLVEAFRTGEPVHCTTERIAPGIQTRRAEFKVQPFDGLLALSVIDRTNEYDAETEAAALRRLLIVGVENSPTAFALLRPVCDASGEIVVDVHIEQANDAAAALLGLTTLEVVGRTLYSLVRHRRGALAALVQQCLTTGQMISLDWDFRDFELRVDWLRIQLTPFGKFVVVHAEDISGERREQEILKGIVENAGEVVVFSDKSGLIKFVNPMTFRTFGYTEAELLTSSILSLTHPDDRPAILEEGLALQHLAAVPRRRRVRVMDKAGNVRTMLGSTMAVRAVGGELSGTVTIATDLTDLLASEEAREQLAAELSMAEQRERERIAAELHDGPVQDLTALSMRLGAAISVRSTPELVAAEDILVRAIADLRLVMFQLSPPELDGDRLGQAIHQRAEHLFAETNVNVSVRGAFLPPPSPAMAVTLFRLAQEALVNSFKHAKAKNLTVRLFDSASREMVLEVHDDGRGAEPTEYLRHAAGHYGLTMMQDRARQLGGSCVVTGAPGRGTTVTAKFPRLGEPKADSRPAK